MPHQPRQGVRLQSFAGGFVQKIYHRKRLQCLCAANSLKKPAKEAVPWARILLKCVVQGADMRSLGPEGQKETRPICVQCSEWYCVTAVGKSSTSLQRSLFQVQGEMQAIRSLLQASYTFTLDERKIDFLSSHSFQVFFRPLKRACWVPCFQVPSTRSPALPAAVPE